MNQQWTWTVYEIEHVADGRRYIGLTRRSLDARWKQHIQASKVPLPKTGISRAIQRFGPEAFVRRPIAQVKTRRGSVQALDLERSLIDFRGTEVPGGYNFPFALHPAKLHPPTGHAAPASTSRRSI